MALTTQTAPLTILQAVNEMLQAVGIGQVMSLDAAVLQDASVAAAYQTLSDTSYQIQTSGWYFNTDMCIPFQPSITDGTIPVPNGVAAMSVAGLSAGRYATMRYNGALSKMCIYDLEHFTFNWSNTVGVVALNQEALSDGNLYMDVVTVFPWEGLPQAWRYYIMCSAGAIFGVGRVPNEETFKFSQNAVSQALSAALQFDQDSRVLVPAENAHFRMWRKR